MFWFISMSTKKISDSTLPILPHFWKTTWLQETWMNTQYKTLKSYVLMKSISILIVLLASYFKSLGESAKCSQNFFCGHTDEWKRPPYRHILKTVVKSSLHAILHADPPECCCVEYTIQDTKKLHAHEIDFNFNCSVSILFHLPAKAILIAYFS